MTTPFDLPVTAKMIEFVRSINLPVAFGEVDADAFLPGVAIANGGLLIDRTRLRYPGDVLHEAGHLAMLTSQERSLCGAGLPVDGGQEMGAIAWSYAAAVHLGLDGCVVFHDEGYKGGAASLRDNFQQGHYLGVPYLQWLGLSWEPHQAAARGTPAYPAMVCWLRA
jgi:hypothetical protein